jgi:hypothetical protein
LLLTFSFTVITTPARAASPHRSSSLQGALSLPLMYSQVRATWGIFNHVELTRCAFSAHEKLDSDDYFMGSLSKLEGKLDGL